MVVTESLRTLCALVVTIACVAAVEDKVDVEAGPGRVLTQAETAAAADPKNHYYWPGGDVGAPCYLRQATPRTFWKYNKYCKDGLVCCPPKPFVFPKAAASSAGTNSAGTKNWKGYWYTMGVCAVTCKTPPPPTEYCCAGPGKCKTPVPRPLNFDQLPAAPTSARKGTWNEVQAVIKQFSGRRARSINNRIHEDPSDVGVSSLTKPATICTALDMMRKKATPGTPKPDGQAKVLIRTSWKWPDAATCKFDNPNGKCTDCGDVWMCSGNTLSNGLVLMAAHCMDPNNWRQDTLISLRANQKYPADADPCGIATLPYTINDILVCYNFDNNDGNGNANNCVKDPSMTFLATGVSWNPRPASPDAVSAPYDQAIIFLAQPKTLTAYYQYNYRTNYDPDTPSFLENWSYIGSDCKTCGTVPGSTAVECLLSSTGPATLPDGACKAKCTLGAEKDFIQAPITSLPGNSGSCAIYVPDQCCVAVSSYGLSDDKDKGVCALNCKNFYSPIDPDKPLSDLWAKRLAVLPDATL
ncbi:hypothetical protein OEZ85_007471 [Tetradesmus obliquus]|uniref:Peptidase S1 domain-containing protein n=1 Tax=Tetradesmus obliquus TaxID=3088 RepID=A0ABY8TG83_TETOB|nr:hypothetical protein OEZ85_007471 [Tetradesmus obliquus]